MFNLKKNKKINVDITEESIEQSIAYKNKDWLQSKERLNRVIKLEMLGQMSEYKGDIDNGVLEEYRGEERELVLPDIFIYAKSFSSTETIVYFNTVILNKSLKVLGVYALGSKLITNVVLNEGLEQIAPLALTDNQLKELTIPSTVKMIQSDALHNAFEDNGKLRVLSSYISLDNIMIALGDIENGQIEIIFNKDRKLEIYRKYNRLHKIEKRKNKNWLKAVDKYERRHKLKVEEQDTDGYLEMLNSKEFEKIRNIKRKSLGNIVLNFE